MESWRVKVPGGTLTFVPDEEARQPLGEDEWEARIQTCLDQEVSLNTYYRSALPSMLRFARLGSLSEKQKRVVENAEDHLRERGVL